MANNVSNTLTINCIDVKVRERIKQMIFKEDKEKNKVFTMEILLPRSMVFADADTYDLSWNSAIWGTERDVYHSNFIESGETITISYATAWSPNRGWVENLCCYINHFLGYESRRNIHNIKVEHRYSDYPGNFGGIVEWKPGTRFKYRHYNSYDEYLENHNPDAYKRLKDIEEQMKSDNCPVMKISLPT